MISVIRKRYIGSAEFYRFVLSLALPLLLQNAVSTFVNLLDNVMVGRIGTESMSGVSIVNQLIFVFTLCLLGGSGGASVYGAQFYGKGDSAGVRSTLRFNLVLCSSLTVIGLLVLGLFQNTMISAFLHESENGGDLAYTLAEAKRYLHIMFWGLPPMALTFAYVSTLRVTGDNRLPMWASFAAIGVNLVFNWLLIYGKCGFPVLGVRGAAIATVFSRYIELFLVLRGTHGHGGRDFAKGLYKDFRIEPSLALSIFRKAIPLLINEFFWSLGMTMLNQCYSVRGLSAVAAINISSTVSNLFNTVLITMGNVVGIMMGNLLGAEENERAKRQCPKLIALSFSASLLLGILLILVAPVIPHLYNTSTEVMSLAANILRVWGGIMAFDAIVNCSYWTMRAGGRTLITMLFDCVYTWVVCVPLAWSLVHFTSVNVLQAYLLVNLTTLIKAAAGIILVRKGIWINNLVADGRAAGE